ncbi:hypothetical protein [Maledivibacter halophilus]|uniref:Uncharacterized protein n=1 Tax=Maledivibacter halophilus TaxID=36842 RepID=A0A1T5KF70_9FIRM|nr:hypothetical protein [Maledivibacter halophilus]SKC62008.1 hypothetical protein SAMN02194393_01730 [Maledivibacter halophilus]
MDRGGIIRKIAEEAVRLYFDGYSEKEAFNKAKKIYGWKNESEQ